MCITLVIPPPTWCVLTWLGLSLLYFAYWDRLPRLTPFFYGAGIGLLTSVIAHNWRA